MSDTEEVVIKRKPRNTKPEVAREKLKEKRERLKKEKENMIIEEAKKRLVMEEEQRKVEEQKEKELADMAAANDPMTQMMRRMEEMMSRFNAPKEEPKSEEEVKPKRRAMKKKVETVYAEEVNPIPKQRKPRKKVVYEETMESPSNVFVGNPQANIPQEPEQEYYHQEQPAGNPLLNALAARRGMTSWY